MQIKPNEEISEKQLSGRCFLRKLSDGYVYPYTDALAVKLSEFAECDKKGRVLNAVFSDGGAMSTVEMEIMGSLFAIPENLKDVIESLVGAAATRTPTEADKEILFLTTKLSSAAKDKNQLTKDNLDLDSEKDDLTRKNVALEKEIKILKAAAKKK